MIGEKASDLIKADWPTYKKEEKKLTKKKKKTPIVD